MSFKIEASKRGYLMSGFEFFREEYAHRRKEMDRLLSELVSWLRRQKLPSDLLQELENASRERLSLADDLIALKDGGRLQASDLLNGPRLQRRFEDTLAKVRRLINERHQGLVHQYGNAAKLADTIIFWSEVTLVASLLFAIGSLLHSLLSRRYLEQQLNQNRADLTLVKAAIDATSYGLTITDRDERIIFANQAALSMVEFSFEEVIGRRPSEIFQGKGTDSKTKARIRAAIDAEKDCRVEILNYARSGRAFWIDLAIAPIRDKDGRVTHFVASQSDVTERKILEERIRDQLLVVQNYSLEVERQREEIAEMNRRLEQLASIDGLTGLSNHRTFQERLDESMQVARRTTQPLALLLLDVDRFKSFNDAYGHPNGDIVLQATAHILRDTVRVDDHACRYGGEEFAVVMPNADLKEAAEVAERIRSEIEQNVWPTIPVTASIGVAVWNRSEPKSEFVKRADRALYQAKADGRNRVVVDLQQIAEAA